MALTSVELLVSINFLHSLSAGMVTPFVTPHIMKNGGNHIVIGVLISSMFLCNKISRNFAVLCTINGSLLISFLTNLGLVFYHSYHFVCLNRCLYALSNQVPQFSQDYMKATKPQEQVNKFFNVLNVIRVTAMVLGIIIGGYIMEWTKDFTYISLVATILTVFSLVLMRHLPNVNTKQQSAQALIPLVTQFQQQINNLKAMSTITQWNNIVLNSTYKFAFCIFFNRFAFLLTSYYTNNFITIGYTAAYQIMLAFAATNTMSLLKNKIKIGKTTFEWALLAAGVTLSGLYYAPSYEMYLMLVALMTFSHTVANSLLDDALQFKGKTILEFVSSIDNVINIATPVLFGIICQAFGGQAFKILAILPSVICIYFISQRRRVDVEKKED